MKLAIDVMGFENDPNEAIRACRLFNKQHSDVTFILVGQKEQIQSHLKGIDKFEIVDATDIIKMDTSPVIALRNTNSSMYKAIELVQKGVADGVLSAGSSTCFVPMTYVLLKVIPGINKPAFMPFVPTTNRRGFMFLDTGANKECTGEDLYQFALLATVYCQLVRGIQKPNVGIINVGTEAEKGFVYHKEAHELCKKDLNISYKGFVEPRNLLEGLIDIVIADGYTGNIVLKSLEGGLSALKSALKREYAKPHNWLGAVASIFAIKGVSKTFDYKNNAGALMIGLQKPAVKTHGSADQQQFFSSIQMLYDTVLKDVIGQIAKLMGKKHE